jgi:S-adenosyl methyltransferase
MLILRRVRYLAAETGYRQLLDIASGLPAVGNVHEVAQQAVPRTRVLHVGNDPIAVQHSRGGVPSAATPFSASYGTSRLHHHHVGTQRIEAGRQTSRRLRRCS